MGYSLTMFNLQSKEQKMQLVELLLLVGTLSATFNLMKEWIWFYMLFALTSIVYFIVIQKLNRGNKEKTITSWLSFFIAVLFSGLISGNFFISLPKPVLSTSLLLSYSIVLYIMFALYYIVFMLLIWAALKEN